DFTQEARHQTVFSGAEIAVAVGRKPTGNPFGFARGDHIEYRSGRDGAGHLRENVGKNVGGLEAASGPEPNGNGTIEMPAGDVADRISHAQHGQSESQTDSQESDAERWEVRGEHCTAATRECQPEGAKELGPKTSPHIHGSTVGLITFSCLKSHTCSIPDCSTWDWWSCRFDRSRPARAGTLDRFTHQCE